MKRGLDARSCARSGRKDVVGEVKGIEMMGPFVVVHCCAFALLLLCKWLLIVVHCCAFAQRQQPQAPRAEQRLPRTVRAAHTRRGYSCYIYGRQTRGADRAGSEGVTLGVRLWVDFGSRGRLHDPASPFGCCGTRVANPTPRHNEPQGEEPVLLGKADALVP